MVASQVRHVSITIVCGRVSSGNEALNVPQPDAMADASNVHRDRIVVPESMSPAQVKALAMRKALAQVGDDDMVAFCISTDHGRSAVSVAPRSSGVTATR